MTRIRWRIPIFVIYSSTVPLGLDYGGIFFRIG